MPQIGWLPFRDRLLADADESVFAIFWRPGIPSAGKKLKMSAGAAPRQSPGRFASTFQSQAPSRQLRLFPDARGRGADEDPERLGRRLGPGSEPFGRRPPTKSVEDRDLEMTVESSSTK